MTSSDYGPVYEGTDPRSDCPKFMWIDKAPLVSMQVEVHKYEPRGKKKYKKTIDREE